MHKFYVLLFRFCRQSQMKFLTQIRTTSTQKVKRFWKQAKAIKSGIVVIQFLIDESILVMLDNRKLKTINSNLLSIPLNRPILADMISIEYETQKTLTKPHLLPLVIPYISMFVDIISFKGN